MGVDAVPHVVRVAEVVGASATRGEPLMAVDAQGLAQLQPIGALRCAAAWLGVNSINAHLTEG